MKPARDRWLNPALALVLCAAAGALMQAIRAPLVTAAHVTRVIVLITSTAPVFRLARRLL